MRIRNVFLVAAFVISPCYAAADPIADFYRGKQIQLIIRAAPGGNYDIYLRTLARHLVRHIPGNPTAVPLNLPGGGGLTALNHFDKVAPRDGTAITMMTQTAPMDQALGIDQKLKIDMRKLNWLGNMSDENIYLVSTRASQTKTLDDAKRRETTLSSTGAAGVEVMLVSMFNQVLGTKFKNILGYRSSPEMNLAMQRGETEGRITTNLRALFAASAGGASDYNIIIQTGVKKAPEYPDVPLLRDLARNQNEQVVLDFISNVMALSRPVATQDNVPPERVEALRRAFDATMKDPDFLADAKKQDLDISPWTGEELQKVVQAIVDAPASVVEQVQRALQTGSPSEQRREDKAQ
jgi:tripartite-type tricarboxylate transporter receptor subunit TctC